MLQLFLHVAKLIIIKIIIQLTNLIFCIIKLSTYMYKNKYFPITLDTIRNDLYRETYVCVIIKTSLNYVFIIF